MKRALAITLAAVVSACALLAAAAQAHPAWGIAVDRQGQVYFSDLKSVWKIDARGRLTLFRAGGDSHTHDLNLDEAGNLYGAENSYQPATKRFFSAVWRMTPAGVFSYLLPPTEDPPEGTSIWKDREGNAYHATHFPGRELLVLKRSPDGVVTALVGSVQAAREYRQGVPYGAGGMAFGADGTLYFTHGANVSKLTPGRALTPLARDLVLENASNNRAGGRPPTELFGIAVDAQGNAFVADHGNRRVLKITPDGQMTTAMRAEEPWFPTGVAARDGELYVLEEGHTPAYAPVGTRVRKLSQGGAISVLATVGENRAGSGNASTGESPSVGESPLRTGEPAHKASYALAGAGAGAFALSVLAWGIRRRTHGRRHKSI